WYLAAFPVHPGPGPEISQRHAGNASRSGPSFEVAFREVADGGASRRRSGRMAAQVLVDREAVERLTELGLSAEIIERVARRAEAEAGMCTQLDPPIMEGLTRWSRMNRYLREELIPGGWRFDNPRNLPRTIHPRGEFAIVATTGDELTGVADLLPATK